MLQSYLRDVVFRCLLAFLLVITISAAPLLVLEQSLLRLILVLVLSFLSFLVSVWWIGLSVAEKGIVKILVIDTISFLVRIHKLRR